MGSAHSCEQFSRGGMLGSLRLLSHTVSRKVSFVTRMSSQMTYFMLSAPMFPCGKDERICATKESAGDFHTHCSFCIVARGALTKRRAFSILSVNQTHTARMGIRAVPQPQRAGESASPAEGGRARQPGADFNEGGRKQLFPSKRVEPRAAPRPFMGWRRFFISPKCRSALRRGSPRKLSLGFLLCRKRSVVMACHDIIPWQIPKSVISVVAPAYASRCHFAPYMPPQNDGFEAFLIILPQSDEVALEWVSKATAYRPSIRGVSRLG
jgi:hypothetical protein